MDYKDWALQVVTGELGQLLTPPLPPYDPEPITSEAQSWAIRYLAERTSRRV